VNNRYGVDVSYFAKELSALSKSLPDRTPDELSRYLIRLSEVAKPLEAAERRKTVRSKRPVQQLKQSIALVRSALERLGWECADVETVKCVLKQVEQQACV